METSDVIASAALVVSLLSLGISLLSVFHDRSRLVVTAQFYEENEYGPAKISVAVINKGRRPVVLRTFGGHDSSGAFSGTYFDHGAGGKRLGERERHDIQVLESDLLLGGPDGATLFEVLWVEDSLGQRHEVPNSREYIKRMLKT